MMLRASLPFACALAAAPAAASAAGPPGAPPPLDAVAAVAYALAHTPSLLAQRATIANLAATFAKTRAGEYPALQGELQNQIARSHDQSGQFAQFGVSPTSNFSQNTAQLATTYDLYNGTKSLAAGQTKKAVQGAIADLARQEEQTAVTVTDGFYNLAALHGVVTLDENDLRYQQTLLETARAAERVGRVAGIDVLRAQVAVARSTSALVQARTDEANARENLAVRIGAPTDTAFAVPSDVPEPAAPTTPAATLAAIAQANRPEIASARDSLDASRLADAQVDGDLRPTVQANASFGSQIAPTTFVQQQQQIDATNAANLAAYETQRRLFPTLSFPVPVALAPVDRHTPGFWQFGIVSTFAVPLFDYGTRASAHRSARAQIDASRASLANAYDGVRADVDGDVRNVAAAAERLRLAKLGERSARETARIAQLQYRAGLISFTDATQTEQTALSAENDLVAARVNYVTAVVKLRVALAPPDLTAAADLRGL